MALRTGASSAPMAAGRARPRARWSAPGAGPTRWTGAAPAPRCSACACCREPWVRLLVADYSVGHVRLLQTRDLVLAERKLLSSQRILKVFELGRTHDGSGDAGLVQQPRQRYLGGGDPTL